MSYVTLAEGAAPSTPAAGKGSHYNSTVGEPHFLNNDGVDLNLSPNRKYNWIRNSGFWLAQRQVPGTLTTYSATTNRAMTADGWAVTNENASVQYKRTDTSAALETGLSNRFYGTFSKITASGKILICQTIENIDSLVLRSSTVRVQIWAKADSTTTWRLGLAYNSGAVQDPTPSSTALVSAFNAGGTDPTLSGYTLIAPKSGVAADNGTVVSNAVDIAVTTVWQRFGAVFDVPSGPKNVVPMIWSNSQVTLTTGSISLSQVSLTEGYAIQDWAPTSMALEFPRCQRFYSKSFQPEQAPAQSAGVSGVMRGHVSVAGAAGSQPIGLRLPVVMRTAPSTTYYNPSAANAFVRNITAGTDATATGNIANTEVGVDCQFTGIAAWTVGQAVAIHFSADAEL